jgi:hypothetical protein
MMNSNPISQPLSQDERTQSQGGKGHYYGSLGASQDYSFMEFNTQGSEYDYPEFTDTSQTSSQTSHASQSWNTQSQQSMGSTELRNGNDFNRRRKTNGTSNNNNHGTHDGHMTELNFEETFEDVEALDFTQKDVDLPEHACRYLTTLFIYIFLCCFRIST